MKLCDHGLPLGSLSHILISCFTDEKSEKLAENQENLEKTWRNLAKNQEKHKKIQALLSVFPAKDEN